MWLYQISEYFVTKNFMVHYSKEQKKKLALRALRFSLVHGKLYRHGQDQVLKRCHEDSKIPIML